MRFLVTYTHHDTAHARCVDACCEAAAIAATQRHARHGASWKVRLMYREDDTGAEIDIIGGSAACPLRGNHTETET